MGGELVGRVSKTMLLLLAPVVVGSALLAGWQGAVGALAGGLISLGSFRWIASGVTRSAEGGLAFSALAVGVRHLALFAALALVLWSGAGHPMALVAGLSLLPPVLVARGLSAARLCG
jgi:hypothetical protein